MTENEIKESFGRLSLTERVASIEATNKFIVQTLEEVSKSLKEMAKTQNMIILQKEEMRKVTETISDIQKSVVMITQVNYEQTHQLGTLANELKQVKAEIDEISEVAEKNKNHLGLMIKVGSAILE